MKSLSIGCFAMLAVASAPVAPATDSLPALARLEMGEWALVARDSPKGSRRVCVANGRALLQLEHSNISCTRFVIASSPKEATVHYTCPGQGHGRTTIRVESARLAQIETQGIVAGAPFSAMFEARRVGVCAARADAAPR